MTIKHPRSSNLTFSFIGRPAESLTGISGASFLVPFDASASFEVVACILSAVPTSGPIPRHTHRTLPLALPLATPVPLVDAVAPPLAPLAGAPLPLPIALPPLVALVLEIVEDIGAGVFCTAPLAPQPNGYTPFNDQNSQESSIDVPPQPASQTRPPPSLSTTKPLPSRTLPRPSEALRPRCLREIDTERAHVQPVQEAAKALVEPRQTLVQELEMQHVGLQVCEAVAQLGEGGLEAFERLRPAG
ncbi:hypothetical protein M8818_000142 [Zalaria obscura]|uniref:Uncharacterized protein n=1 Tax=Zalaria obscura TaxID=2024903 RepID=A0ACC3SNR5_9PEZI